LYHPGECAVRPHFYWNISRKGYAGHLAKIKRLDKANLLTMVHLCNLSWNQIVPSLRLMQSKLIDLGFEYYNGNIVMSEMETEGSQYHA
jgi:hypothetical protein